MFIIDSYDKYSADDRDSARYIFSYNDQQWAIKEYPYENGKLMRPLRIDEDERENYTFCLYENYADAFAYVQLIKSIN